jgi:signal recognition particle subunit SEC65
MESIKDYSKEKNWIKVYPIYIDKNTKLSEGRKVAIKYAVEQPVSSDIYQALTKILNLPCKLEEEVKILY